VSDCLRKVYEASEDGDVSFHGHLRDNPQRFRVSLRRTTRSGGPALLVHLRPED
jgi:hypothetical protein